MLNKEDINLQSDILILTLFPKKSIFSTIEQQLNSTIIEILHNNTKNINAYENYKKTKDYNKNINK